MPSAQKRLPKRPSPHIHRENPSPAIPPRSWSTEPLFDPFLFRALRKVGCGEIGTTTVTGALRQRNDDLPIRLFTALHMLRRDAHIRLATTGPDPRDGWIVAELTDSGNELLNSWNAQIQSSATASSAR